MSINGKEVRSPDLWINPKHDRICLDGNPIKPKDFVYLAMNKPAGIVTTRADERGRSTVYDFLPASHRWVFPVGRLDKETSGLLLFTNDTRFGDRVTSPLESIPKTYLLSLDRPLSQGELELMESGMRLPDGTLLLPAHISVDPAHPKTLTIVIHEGKNRQVRRMCEAVGVRARALHRLSIGPIKLGALGEGAVRPLTEKERELIHGSSGAPV